MYQIVICEDQPAHAGYLGDLVRACGEPFQLRASCASVPELDMCLQEHGMPDILLMDIALGDANGIDAVKELVEGRAATQVIYVTGYVEYCTSVYETEHVSFLLKPVELQALRHALERAAEKAEKLNRESLALKTPNGAVLIPWREILYLESRGRILTVHTEADAFSAYMKLDEAEALLDARFYRCHKSFLVNLDAVSELCPPDFRLRGGAAVPISTRKRAEAKDVFFRRLSARLSAQ